MATKHRILVVEDDAGTAHLLAQIVQRAGYVAVVARGAREALAYLQEEEADLLLLDLMMREMDGWSLLEIIKSDARLAPLPVIIVSARHPQEDPVRTQAHAGMFVDYLLKPFEVDELVARIKQVLGQSL